jgi:hypothetical protein
MTTRRLTVFALSLFGCDMMAGRLTDYSGDLPAQSRRSITSLELKSNGQGLELAGSPIDARYTATYPNPLGLTAMNFQVLANGTTQSDCLDAQGRKADCSDPPFFWNFMPTGPDSRRLQVRDLYGQLVVDRPDQTVPADLNADLILVRNGVAKDKRKFPPPTGSGPVPGATPPPLVAKSTGTVPGGPGVGSVPGGGLPPPGSFGGGAGLCADTLAQGQVAFCAAINAKLAEKGISNYTIDCNMVRNDNLFRYHLGEQQRTNRPATRAACMSIVSPAYNDMLLEATPEGHQCGMLMAGLSWMQNARQELLSQGICNHSPLILDLAGDGLALSAPEAGVRFDLLGTGKPVECAWPRGKDDAFLVMDRNGNGKIDGAAELFGNDTAGVEHENGFSALSDLDANHDGWVDAADPQFARLRLWRDANHDGKSQPSELTTLARAGIVSLEVAATQRHDRVASDAFGNWIPLEGQFVRKGGGRGRVYDAFLRYLPTREEQDDHYLAQGLRKILGPLAP